MPHCFFDGYMDIRQKPMSKATILLMVISVKNSGPCFNQKESSEVQQFQHLLYPLNRISSWSHCWCHVLSGAWHPSRLWTGPDGHPSSRMHTHCGRRLGCTPFCRSAGLETVFHQVWPLTQCLLFTYFLAFLCWHGFAMITHPKRWCNFLLVSYN